MLLFIKLNQVYIKPWKSRTFIVEFGRDKVNDSNDLSESGFPIKIII